MSKPFEPLRGRLLAAGVAPRHVARYLDELADHQSDVAVALEQEGMSRRNAEAWAHARMGSFDDLAGAMIARPELRSWVARAPWAAFLAAPLAGFVALLAASLAILVVIVQAHRPAPIAPANLPEWFDTFRVAVSGLDLYVLPVLLGWAVALVALRRRVALLWPLIGLVAVAVLGGAAEITLVVPTAPGMHGEISIGTGLLPPYFELAESLVRIFGNLLLTLPLFLVRRQRQTGAPG